MEDVLIVVSIQCYYGHELKEILLDNDEVCDLGVIILPFCQMVHAKTWFMQKLIFPKLYKIIQKIGYLLRTFKNRSKYFMNFVIENLYAAYS